MARPFSVALGAAEFLITSTPTAIRPKPLVQLQTSLLLPRDETRIAFRIYSQELLQVTDNLIHNLIEKIHIVVFSGTTF